MFSLVANILPDGYLIKCSSLVIQKLWTTSIFLKHWCIYKSKSSFSSFYKFIKSYTCIINTWTEFPISKKVDLIHFGLELLPLRWRIYKSENIRKKWFSFCCHWNTTKNRTITYRPNFNMWSLGVHKDLQNYTREVHQSKQQTPGSDLPAIRPSAHCWLTPQSASILEVSNVGSEINFQLNTPGGPSLTGSLIQSKLNSSISLGLSDTAHAGTLESWKT